MVAVPEDLPAVPEMVVVPARPTVPPAPERRIVAVSVDATELLRPESDLLRLIAGAGHVDVLLAGEVGPVGAPAPLGMLAGATAPAGPCVEDDAEDDDGDALLADVERLGVPELHVHRLGLRCVSGPAAESDLVAGLSELIGFDPEPGVSLLGPSGGGPDRALVQRAVQRVAQVYGIPVRRYRCLELLVVDPAD